MDGKSLGMKRGRARGTIGVVGNSRGCRVSWGKIGQTRLMHVSVLSRTSVNRGHYINYPFGGYQTMQRYGNSKGVPGLRWQYNSGDSWMYPYQRNPLGNPYINL